MKSNLRKMPVYAPITDNEPMEAIGHRIQSFTSTRANHPALITEQGTVGWRALLERTNQIAARNFYSYRKQIGICFIASHPS